MTDELRDALDELTPPPDDERPDWGEVLRRAEVQPAAPSRNGHVPHARRTRGLLPALALAAALACGLALLTPVGPAIARTLGDFTDWLTGEPGQPAPQAKQEAFTRSTRSWEGFPPGTQLRQLAQTRAAGMTLTLYGFRGAGSLCLRLAVAGARVRPELTCPRLTELASRAQPALVVTADRAVGSGKGPSGPLGMPEPAVRATYGIVADGVERVEVRRNDGTTSEAVVSGDSFLDVDTHPSFSRRVATVWAIAGKRRVAIPFAPETSLFGPPTVAGNRPPRGPSKVERKLHGGTVGWLARREPRGIAVPTTVHHIVGVLPGTFAREITPDPSAPERMVVSKRELVCADLVGGRYEGGGCWTPGQMFARAPFAYGVNISGQYVTIAGLASDDVARLALFLATGERRRVPLHDNGYVVEAPRASYPLRLVGYDSAGRVIGVATFKQFSSPAWERRPAPGAAWRPVLRNDVGTVFAVRATPRGSCYAVHVAGAGGSLTCPPPAGPTTMDLGINGGSAEPNRALEGRTGSSIARVVVTFDGGGTQTVVPTRGFVLARLRRGAVVDSIAGFDAAGRRVAVRDWGRSRLVGGEATIHTITSRWIVLGPSAARSAKLHAKGLDTHTVSCRRLRRSPPLAGYRPGVRVSYLCRGGVLTRIARAG